MGDHDEEMPRAKRLKMLREAKERKERLERGEPVDDGPTADVPMDKRAEEEAEEEEDNVAEGEQLIKAIDSQMADDRDDEKNDNDEEEDVLNLAPKRANWDIERDIAPMLKKLERRTQHAIVEILSTGFGVHTADMELIVAYVSVLIRQEKKWPPNSTKRARTKTKKTRKRKRRNTRNSEIVFYGLYRELLRLSVGMAAAHFFSFLSFLDFFLSFLLPPSSPDFRFFESFSFFSFLPPSPPPSST
jgi:coiled-coil domain-containing protein 12